MAVTFSDAPPFPLGPRIEPCCRVQRAGQLDTEQGILRGERGRLQPDAGADERCPVEGAVSSSRNLVFGGPARRHLILRYEFASVVCVRRLLWMFLDFGC